MEQKPKYQIAPHHLQSGSMLSGKYSVETVLGEGGFGITYMGHDKYLDIKVAIKEYFPSGIVNRNNTYSQEITVHIGDSQNFFEKSKKNFLEEARTLAKFCDEESIVSVRDFFEENNTAYIVMEYLEGMDLKDFLAQKGKMTFEETVTLMLPIMNALSKVHAKGLIHRDISPSNIKILENGTAKLLDFGAARNVSGLDEKSLSILLKPGYAPEEQYRTKGKQGSWTDVYALSATMYKMLTGVTPDDAMNRIFSDDIVMVTAMNASVTDEQNAIIMKGMAVNQANRYQTIEELRNACLASLNASAHNSIQGENSMFCDKCGNKVEDGAKFCTYCGVALAEVHRQAEMEERTYVMQNVKLNEQPTQSIYAQNPVDIQHSVYTQQSVNVQQQVNTQQPIHTQQQVHTQQPIYPQQPMHTQQPMNMQQPVYTQQPMHMQHSVCTQQSAHTQQSVYMQQPMQLQNTYTQYGSEQAHAGSVSFGMAIKLFFIKYVDFTGRASRSEYWWAFLFSFLVSMVCAWIPVLGKVVMMGLMIPGLSIGIRRLHDIGKSWAWIFMGLIPLAGFIILIVYYCTDSDGDNLWGPGPRKY